MAGAASGAYIPPPGKYLSVDVGDDHVCAIRSDRRVRCWGVNLDGEAVPPAGRFVAVSAGGEHSCGIRANATLACWGRHDFGRSLPSGSFTAIGSGRGLTCALRTEATVTCLGLGAFDAEPAGTYTSISTGAEHSCGVSSDTTLACWGSNGWHQSEVPPGSFSAVSAGLVHTCAIRDDASLACWGGEHYFEFETLGTPPAGSFRSVSAGHTHSCAIRTDRTIACWGQDGFDSATPPRGRFTSVSAGHVNTCAIRTNARLVCWGRDYGGPPLEAADAFSLPSCVVGRSLTMRVNRLPRFLFMRVVVKVGGKRVKVLKGVGVSGPVRLTRLPKGRFKFSVTVFAIGKPPVTAKRTYRRCTGGAKQCGTVPIDHHEAGQWDGVVEVARGGHPCEEAMVIARTAAAEPFGIGDDLPAPNGWFCMASFRPTADTVPRYVLGCWQGAETGPPPEGYAIGVRFPKN